MASPLYHNLTTSTSTGLESNTWLAGTWPLNTRKRVERGDQAQETIRAQCEGDIWKVGYRRGQGENDGESSPAVGRHETRPIYCKCKPNQRHYKTSQMIWNRL